MHQTFKLLACSCTLFLSSVCTGADWAQFRGPGGLGVSEEKDLPLTWSDDENLAWKLKLPGYGSSSPIAVGDKLFVTCYSGYGTGGGGTMDDLTLHLVCVSRMGDIVWDQKIAPKLPESQRVRDHGYAGPTPASDGKHVYVFFGKTGVLKFDLEGNKLWQANVGDGLHGWGCGTSPVLYKNLVIVNASVESSSLVALDKETGDEVWRAGGMRSSWNTPHLVGLDNGKHELAVSVHSKILGFDPETGDQLWTCDGIQDYICPSIVSQKGIVYAIGGRSSQAIAIKAGGRGNVTDTHKLWHARVGANVSSPAIHDGHLYWVSDRKTTAYCLRLSDGEVMYEQRFPQQPYASAIIGDGKVYIVTRRGGTYVLAAKPEYEELSHNKFEDRTQFNASPIISEGQLFMRSEEYLYCVGKRG